MAKEMMIVFIYDTEYCQKESDDPVNAVLYFHPSWVSDVQKLSLCGQLMGTCHFLSDTFFRPKSISLQSGKFILKNFNRFILAVGTDRNIAESILEHRASLLSSLVNLYHCDIQTVCDQFNENQTKNLSDKLYHIFETYLPILQYNGNLFQNIPTLRLPKSSNINYLEAMQTLQGCQQLNGVLGGTIIYHNKVVSTQLSSDLTKILVATDPHRIKSTTDQISVHFHIPNGVQLINVFIKTSEYNDLKKLSERTRNAFEDIRKTDTTTTISDDTVVPPAPLIPFILKKKINTIKDPTAKSTMKRDQSLIFTNIPEEEISSPSNSNDIQIINKKFNRPNHLPLRFKNMTAKELPESGFHSINFDETDSFPNFIGKTSICSTPMTENKVLHNNFVSIIANQTQIVEVNNEDNIKTPVKESLTESTKIITIDRRYNSWSGIDSVDIMKLTNNVDTPDDDSVGVANKRCNSITDPVFPIFTNKGKPLSKKSYDDYILYKYKTEDLTVNSKLKPFQNFDLVIENRIKDKMVKTKEDTLQGMEGLPISKPNEDNCENNKKSNLDIKRKLSLPIKSLTLDLNIASNTEGSIKNSSIFDSPARRKKLGGIQLTPLMAKLTILEASMNDERSSGFSSYDTTPGYSGAVVSADMLQTPIDIKTFNYKRKPSLPRENVEVEIRDGNILKKVDLFICGQQNMTMLLIMEEHSSKKQDLIQTLFETCIAKLTKIESNLNQVLNINVENGDKREGSYSFICVDPRWDIIHRGGPWSPSDLNSLEYMHSDFNKNQNFTEMILRGDDSVIYGYQCGKSEVFYQQSAVRQSGLPPPADAMGTVQLCAKRRLERDHSILIL